MVLSILNNVFRDAIEEIELRETMPLSPNDPIGRRPLSVHDKVTIINNALDNYEGQGLEELKRKALGDTEKQKQLKLEGFGLTHTLNFRAHLSDQVYVLRQEEWVQRQQEIDGLKEKCEGSLRLAKELKEQAVTAKLHKNLDSYKKLSDEIEEYFAKEKMHVALACYRILKRKKGFQQDDISQIKLRKNGYMPSIGHEIEFVHPLIRRLKFSPEGLSFQKSFESEYKMPIEEIFIAMIVHDIGEENGLFYEDMRDEIIGELHRMGVKYGEYEHHLAGIAAEHMERLTDCRKFKMEDLERLFGEDHDFEMPDFSHMHPGDIMPLEQFNDKFWNLMDYLPDHGRDNLQVYAYWEPPKEKASTKLQIIEEQLNGRKVDRRIGPPSAQELSDMRDKKLRIIVTRYGYCHKDTPVGERLFAVDEGVYHATVVKDIACDIAKRVDTNQNGSTMLARGDSPSNGQHYVDKKNQIWDGYTLEKSFGKNNYISKTAEPLIVGLDETRKITAEILRFYYNLAADHENNKRKTISPFNNPTIEFVTRALGEMDFYKYSSDIAHPLCNLLVELYEAPPLGLVQDPKAIYNTVLEALKNVGGEKITARIERMDGMYFNLPEDQTYEEKLREISREIYEINKMQKSLDHDKKYREREEQDLANEAMAAKVINAANDIGGP